jgi:hypothetical protein
VTHTYISTACHHELHRRCRDLCKFCEEPCSCSCHGTSGNVTVHVQGDAKTIAKAIRRGVKP